MTLGEKLDLYCLQRGWRLADLARAAQIDVKTLAAQRKRRTLTSKFAPQLAAALDISVDELLEDAAPRTHPARQTPAPYVAPLNPVETQLLGLFRGCSPHRRDDLLRMANLYFVENHPGASVANPFPAVRPPPTHKVR
jgi:transcriptional regulator with XRE-family HTH domain